MTEYNMPDILQSMDIFDDSDHLFNLKKALCALSMELPTNDKYDILVWISARLNSISDDDYQSVINWNLAVYKKICDLLKKGLGANLSTIEIVNMLRWGGSGVIKDVDTGKLIINKYYPDSIVINSPANFSPYVLYAHANLLSHFFDNCVDEFEKRSYAYMSIPLLEKLSTSGNWFRNRSYFYLSNVYFILGDIVNAVSYFIDTIVDDNSLPHHKRFILKIIFGNINLPTKLEQKMISGDSVLNPYFWWVISINVTNVKISNNAALYSKALFERKMESYGSSALTDDDFTLLNSYLFLTKSDGFHRETDVELISKIAEDEKASKKVRSDAYKKIAFHYLISGRDKLNVIYFLSMSLYFYGSDELKVKIQSLFIDSAEDVILLVFQDEFSCGHSQAFNLIKKARKTPVWVNGDTLSEIGFIERVIEKSYFLNRSDINRLAKLRASFIYILGSCVLNDGLRVQNFKQGDLYLDELVFSGSDKIKKDIRNYGFYRHQHKLINHSKNGDYIFLENKDSDRLIIVFSCRYSYDVFTSVPSFVKNTKSNVLFLNNPPCDWYSDDEEIRINKLLEELVFNIFDKNNILCYSGSMGGYAAVKFSYEHNLMCLAANPQFNLNFWALARPADASRIFSIKNIVNLDKIACLEHKALRACIVLGRHPFDILAFQSWFNNAIRSKDFTFIIIKHDIAEHAGLMIRAYGDNYINFIYEKFDLLRDISDKGLGLHDIEFHDLKSIQYSIMNARQGEWILKSVNGKLLCL